MGHFDFLIDKRNKKPDTNKEYIYTLGMVFYIGKLDSKKVDEEIIVHDVIQMDNGGYEFTIKETGERFSSNYGWAFWENTPENSSKIKAFREKEQELKKLQKELSKLRKNIDKLSDKW